MGRKRKNKEKAELWNNKSLGELAEAEVVNFFARYSNSAERVAVLVLEKIRAKKKSWPREHFGHLCKERK